MPEVQPDNQAAIDFLKRWAPGGPWVLTAIQTDRKAISTQTFGPGTEAALIAFLSDYNGKRNLYFHVNPPMKALSKKAEREDIKSMDWLHVDIDPRAGEDLEQERARCLALFTTNLPKGIPAPTVIIFSGGGYQGFWRLDKPVEINGDVPAAEKAKLFNLQLEHVFGGDHCHNIDRIMRLPGTVNIPDAKKIKKGRTATLAALIQFNDGAYPISAFTAAPELQLPNEPAFGSGSFGKTTVVAPGNIERLGDISELDQWSVPDRVKVIIVQGRHPDEPKPEHKNSRSEWLFDAVCQMVRHAVPDDVIYAVITDPQFAISESILEKGGGAEKYALKQLRSAKESRRPVAAQAQCRVRGGAQPGRQVQGDRGSARPCAEADAAHRSDHGRLLQRLAAHPGAGWHQRNRHPALQAPGQVVAGQPSAPGLQLH
jgi:hypothetical protein